MSVEIQAAPGARARRPGKRRKGEARQPWMVLAACLIAPAVAGVLRKLAPGQPASFEIGGIVAVLAAFAWLLLRRRSLPGWVLTPLLVWAYFQLIYAGLALMVDWRVGVAATLTRIVPIVMAGVAYAAVRNLDDLQRASSWAGMLAVALVPVGVVVAIFGYAVMPIWLRPILEMEELGRVIRGGVPAVVGVFSTQSVLSMSMLAVLYLSLANAAFAGADRRPTRKWWVFAISALVLIFLSSRRGAFIAGVAGLVAYLLGRDDVRGRLVVVWGVVLGGGLMMTQIGRLEGRAALMLEILFNLSYQIPFRLIDVFGKYFIIWVLSAPFGTYLGFAGPEADALLGVGRLRQYSTSVFEVGAAQLLAEVGILGALLLPAVLGILIWQINRRSKGLRCRRGVVLLLVFQVLFFSLYYMKEESMMTGVSMGQLFFWAVPGICAALIVRERKERRYWRRVWGQRLLSQREGGAVGS